MCQCQARENKAGGGGGLVSGNTYPEPGKAKLVTGAKPGKTRVTNSVLHGLGCHDSERMETAPSVGGITWLRKLVTKLQKYKVNTVEKRIFIVSKVIEHHFRLS